MKLWFTMVLALAALATTAATPKAPAAATFQTLSISKGTGLFFETGSVKRSGARLSVRTLWVYLVDYDQPVNGRTWGPEHQTFEVALDCDWGVELERLEGGVKPDDDRPMALDIQSPLMATLCDPSFTSASKPRRLQDTLDYAAPLIDGSGQKEGGPLPLIGARPPVGQPTNLEPEPFAYGLVAREPALNALRYIDWRSLQRNGGRATARIMTLVRPLKAGAPIRGMVAIAHIDCEAGRIGFDQTRHWSVGSDTVWGSSLLPPDWTDKGRPATAATLDQACHGERPTQVATTFDELMTEAHALLN